MLVVSDLDRLGRDGVETPYAVKQLNMAGVRVFAYLDGQEIRLDSPITTLITQVQAFGTAIEREKARRRAADAMGRKARSGHVCGGACYGYRHVAVLGSDGRRSHVDRQVHEPEAAVVRRLFEMAAAGCRPWKRPCAGWPRRSRRTGSGWKAGRAWAAMQDMREASMWPGAGRRFDWQP